MKFYSLFTGFTLLCQVAPIQCLPEGEIDAVPAAIKRKSLTELEERQDLFYPDNEKRRDRVIKLRSDITAIENFGADFWESYTNQTPFWKSVLHDIAVARGFPDAPTMVREKIEYQVYPADREEVQRALDDYSNAEDVSSILMVTGGAIAGTSLVGEVVGRKSGLLLADQITPFKWVFRNFVATVRAPLTIGRAEFEYRSGLIDLPTKYERQRIARKRFLGFKSPGWKWLGKVLSVLEIADVFLFIGELIFEGVEGRNQMEEMQGLIRDLSAARFAKYTEYKATLALQEWNSAVFGSFLNRVSLQDLINNGNACYEAAEAQLATQLGQFSQDWFSTAQIDHQVWYNELKEQFDSDSETWDDEDPNLDEILNMFAEAENEVESEEPEYPDTPDDDYTVTGTDVPAAELTYFEFSEEKGAIWKLHGPQWSIQFPWVGSSTPGVDVDGDGIAAQGNALAHAHHMLQLNQTLYENKIFLQTVDIYSAEGGIYDSHGDITVIDLDSYTLKKITGDIVADAAGEWISNVPESTWQSWISGYEMNVETLTNRIPGNFWTASAVVVEGGVPEFVECNKNTGWEYVGAQNERIRDIQERGRTATSLRTARSGAYSAINVVSGNLNYRDRFCENPEVDLFDCYFEGYEEVTIDEDHPVKEFHPREIFA